MMLHALHGGEREEQAEDGASLGSYSSGEASKIVEAFALVTLGDMGVLTGPRLCLALSTFDREGNADSLLAIFGDIVPNTLIHLVDIPSVAGIYTVVSCHTQKYTSICGHVGQNSYNLEFTAIKPMRVSYLFYKTRLLLLSPPCDYFEVCKIFGHFLIFSCQKS
jgi:hypothetical protein